MSYTKSGLPIDMVQSEYPNIQEITPSIEKLATGFRFVEGPVWISEQKKLIFSDIPGNALYAWTQIEGISMLRENSYLANGNTLDPVGDLVTCEHATSRVTRTNLSTGRYSVVVDSYQGKALNSPNDIVAKSNGSLYFTDPIPGRQPRVGIPRAPELSFRGVYLYDDKTAFLYLLDDSLTTPNGLCFSADESQLFVNDSATGEIWLYDLDAKGMLKNKTLWGRVAGDGLGCADGMKLHPNGQLFCTGPGGIYQFAADGKLICRMKMPEVAANIVFADAGKTLYVTATTSIYRITLT